MPAQADASSIQAATTVTTPRQHFDMGERARRPIVDALDPHRPAVQRLKAIVDDRRVPDTGRMDG